MRTSLLALLLVAFGLVTLAPTGVRAATLYDGDYVRVGVPDLEQAVAFFQDVLDCRLIGPESVAATAVPNGAPASRLVSCGAGSIIELFNDRGAAAALASRPTALPLQFVSDDVPHAGQWLRRGGADVTGSPHRVTTGPLAGRMVLDFVSPWGLRLQLVGSDIPGSAGSALATADAQYDGG